MTEPSQYFKGRTVQEQMNEVIGYVDVRSAEVATDAIAADVAQVHQDMLDADADASAAAASAAAAAGTLANAVKKTGEASQSIAGDVAVAGTLSGGVVTGTQVTVPAPVNNTDAATKKYVDDQDALDVHLAGVQSITGAKTVPLEATGTFSNQIASSNKMKNELDNYAPMVRTTGNQTIAGNKSLQNASIDYLTVAGTDFQRRFQINRTDDDANVAPQSAITYPLISWNDGNLNRVCALQVNHLTNGSYELRAVVRNADGTDKYVTLVGGNP